VILLLLLLSLGVVMVDIVNTGLLWSSVLTTGGEIAYLMSATPSLSSSSWVVMKNCKGEALVRIFEVL